MSGGFRVIEGGRSEEPSPGLLIVGAAEVVTLAGGVRARLDAGRGRPARPPPRSADPTRRTRPVVACWEGRIAAVGPRAEVEAALEAEGYPLGRFARLDAAGGVVTPGLVDPHTHLLFAGSREGELVLRQRGAGYLEILAAGGGILSTVAATRGRDGRGRSPAHGRRWLDEMLGHGVTTIEAKSGYGLDLETEIRLLEVAYRAGPRGPDRRRPDLPRRPRRPARVPGPAGGRRGVRPVASSRSSCPASRPMAGPASATSSARRACSARTSRGGSSRRPRAYGMAPAAARRRARPVRRRRAGRRARGRVGRPPRRAVARPGIDALAAAAATRPAGRRDAPAGDDLVPHEGPPRAGPDASSSAASRSRIGTDFNPGRRRPPACRWR